MPHNKAPKTTPSQKPNDTITKIQHEQKCQEAIICVTISYKVRLQYL